MLQFVLFASALACAILSDGFAIAEDSLDDDSQTQNYGYEVMDAPYEKTTKVKSERTYSKTIKFTGGCPFQPYITHRFNGKLSCSLAGWCQATCSKGYRFPNGEQELRLTCRDMNWKIQGVDYAFPPYCEPICLPDCKNNGICIAPNQCNCTENFFGSQCQFEDKPCLNMPPLIINAQRKCNSKTCTVTCLNHFVFPDGSSVANLICKHGNWEPTRSDWVTIPDCQPVCDPPCQNGGVCLSLNLCQCPKDFRGPQCQYRADACSTERLGFNGGYQCNSVDEHSYACTLNCPSGVSFEFPPAASYVCRYENERFEPQPIPQCNPPEGSRLFVVKNYEKTTYYQSTNRTWSLQADGGYELYKKSSADNFGYSSTSDDSLGILQGGNGVVQMERVEKRMEGGSCFAWAGAHYKTFDGQIYSFESRCSYILLKDTRDGLFTVTVQNDPTCSDSNIPSSRCPRIIRIFVQGKEYTLGVGHSGQSEFRSAKKQLPIPSQLAHLRVESVSGGQFIVVSLDPVGLRMKWDGASLIQVEATESLWNRTAGLCGSLNGEREDDYGVGLKSPMHLAYSWRLDDIGDKCEEYSNDQPACSSDPELERKAREFCAQLLSDSRYKSCANMVDLSGFEVACQWDYCSCDNEDRRTCACNTMGVYVRQCAHKGIVTLSGWRDNNVCPLKCTNGKVYMPCGPKSQASCGADLESQPLDGGNGLESSDCEEGCFCPAGTVLHEGRCIGPEDCPCKLRGKSFKPGSSVPKDCNTCACLAGRWICTESKCAGRCSAVGDPHYTTFDGKRYDFMGQCTYYLLKGEDYSVEAENAACASTISEMMGLIRTYQDGEPSCTKTVSIRVNDVAIKLKQNHQILVNGEDVTKLPMLVGGARVRIVSSIFIRVELPNGLEVLWDGVSRVYINAPAHFRGKTKGLCGTFSSSQKDDFLTPDGDVEQAVVAFANKWKTNEQCADVKKESDHPCDVNPQKRAVAEKYCSVLKKNLFLGCHWHVDYEPFYKDCLYDVCACETNVDTCLCPTLAAYAKDCVQLGVVVPWRQEVQECRVHCPGDQEYQMCGSSCTRSCADISFYQDCKEECVEGCNCPKGYTLNVNGECIPIGQCPCTYSGLEFIAGYREVSPGSKGSELCTCAGGRWSCQLATAEEIKEYPAIVQFKSLCSATRHQEVTTCEPAEPHTCRNMHLGPSQSPALCRPGCVCKPGYVLDLPSDECVREQECPCYHGGRSYKEGSTMQEECNTCRCSAGKWNCTDIVCPGVCTVWGDSHYKTFDDRQYDFQGVCDYVLAKGRLSDAESFDVTIRNVACGTTGVTCSKSVTLTVGKSNNAEQESITLTRGKSLTAESFRGLRRITMRRAGLFIFLDVPDLGLVVQWDEGTRVHVRVDAKWKGLTKGLCGDFNDDAEDDFKTPSGGMSEASASLFADSWKMSELCGQPSPVQPDTCAKHPERRLWAVQRCRVIKFQLFEPCHSEIAPDTYIERCVYDACGCDDGGDCECLCTAIAAYAQECNARGVPIQWRSQTLCPMQCDEACSSYSACVSTCPRETCDNLATRSDSLHLCDQDICVEGCLPKPCPEDQVYLNSSYAECMPRADCKILCAVIDGREYYEGDKIRGDQCHSCFCSRGKEVCKGTPCAPTTLPPTTAETSLPVHFLPIVEISSEQDKKCRSGWTKWFNRDIPKADGFRSDIENIPESIELLEDENSAVCEHHKMTDIQCRTANTKISYKDVGLNVECSLENGLICILDRRLNQTCPDFEIRLLCRCDDSPTPMPMVDACLIAEPYRLVQGDCHEFLQCGPGPRGNEWVRKSCGPDTMFNERLQVCDWPANVAAARPECAGHTVMVNRTEQTVVTENEKSTCPDGERWSDCAVQCSRTCEYYSYLLMKESTCARGIDCVPGCVPTSRVECPANKYWRDRFTCVDRSDCLCKSDDGEPMKPGTIVKVSECKICQCINNFYSCDESDCETNNIEVEKVVHNNKTKGSIVTIIVPSTVTPPRECEGENYVWLIEKSPFDAIFNVSSADSPFMTADSARLRRVATMLTWKPDSNDEHQWVEVSFDKPKPIYGVIVRGDSFEDKYVTSYKVLFSEDGQVFSYVTEPGTNDIPKVLRGPIDGFKPVRQIFHPPIEAKVVRINPTSWHQGIAMQVELVGCDEAPPATKPKPTTTTPIITETVIKPVCDDLMGYDNHVMSDQQVSVSSLSPDNIFLNLRLSSLEIWRPLLDNLDQYVQFDFLEPRNITGIETKGGNGIWTTAYKVHYSNDGKRWNPVIDDAGAEKEFLANVDDYNSKVNYFKRPISARLLRISPTKWQQHIGLKVEVHGCFLPYPPITPLPYISTPPPSECNICAGIIIHSTNQCKCEGSLWWDGFACVVKQECPCVYDHVTYSVGSSFETMDCQHCLCTLGGNPVCQPKSCDSCPMPGHRPVLTELCACLCKPCPAGQRLCPTSKVCIDEGKWCNGVQDCPDDETGCMGIIETQVQETAQTNVIKNTTINIKCQTTCPPGFVMENANAEGAFGTNSVANFGFTVHTSESVKTSYTKVFKITMPAPVQNFQSRMGGDDLEEQMCPKIICKPLHKKVEGQCQNIECPPGFQAKYDQSKSYRKTNTCDNTCVPIPPKERICNVIGRTFSTFDNLDYKYDICNHILARDRDANRWYIVAEKVCKDKDLTCLITLVVTFNGHEVVLHPNMYAYIDGSYYSPSEVKRLGDKNPWMKLSRVGNSLRIESRHYPFWALLDSTGAVKIGASEELAGHVDGMCGFLDGVPQNDQQTPQSKPVKSTQEFGDSWRVLESAECKLQVCPREAQEEAWKTCNLVKDASFEPCAKVVDKEKFVSSCLESSCACLSSGNATSQECRCRVLTSFVSQCLAASKDVDLSTWRSVHNCPTVCNAPFVHKDCFRNKCEMSCGNLQELGDPCPTMDGFCVPGCFCPDGMVRNGDTCVPPAECRDCVCDGFGNSKYVTFDRRNVVFDGNCTYLLSKNVASPVEGKDVGHQYEVYVTNGGCADGICIERITIIYQKHKIEIKKSDSSNQLVSIVDEQPMHTLPYKTSWLNIEETPSRDVTLLIPSIQLELIGYKHHFSFMLRLPSHSFGGSMEGLCGDCDGSQKVDFKMSNGKLTNDMQEFGNSWLVNSSPAEDDRCLNRAHEEKPHCADEAGAERHCRLLFDSEVFVRCHGLVDPTPYYLACKDTLCNSGGACGNYEAYARTCAVAGICLDWRTRVICPYFCPTHLEYRACNSGCPETCNSLENAEPCLASPIEGCFCPPQYVMHNKTCIPRRQCFVCDAEGHIDGDLWQPNKCTQCSCEKRLVKCQEMSCPAIQTVCEQNATPVVVPGTENECCPKYLCVPVTTVPPTCDETQQPECGFGQILKITVDTNGCQKFICQCLPEEQCALLDTEAAIANEILEPGFVKVTNTSGCCPRTTKICKPETCPPPPICQKYHNPIVKESPNSCCSVLECEAPKDLCLYYMDSSNELKFLENLVAKKIGEIWLDGKCKTCTCEYKDGIPTPRCATKDCLTILDHLDNFEFVLKEVPIDSQCCPNFERIACKHDDRVFKMGDKWHPNPNNICLTTECSVDLSGVTKKTLVQECPQTCELGYEYRASSNSSITCCGECVPVACVVGGQLKIVGETWYTDDYCVTSTCLLINGSIHVQTTKETCETISPMKEADYKIERQKIYGKCCPEIVRIGCLSDGEYYRPGETWKSLFDSCIVESCLQTAEGKIVKQKETKTCNTECPKGWEYQRPEPGICCGKCKQVYCIVDGLLYEPGKTWNSHDNCATYSCIQKDDQLLVSTSTVVCPELNCSPDLMYDDGCCKKCNITTQNIVESDCAAEVIDFEKTIGILVEKKGSHGICKNLKPIEGLTECHGHCESSTHFDTTTLNQVVDCKCCKPVDFRKINVDLTCADGKVLKKIFTVPTICFCEHCSESKEASSNKLSQWYKRNNSKNVKT